MKTEISALLDDELDPSATGRAIDALHRDKGLRDAWSEYHLIGDSLRRIPGCSSDFTARVMARLAAEPVILVPPPARLKPSPSKFALPLAAAVTGMAAVAWVALSLNTPQVMEMAAAPRAPSPEPLKSVVEPFATGGLKEYLVAHQAHSPSSRIQGVAPSVRTVSEIRRGGRP